jgi:hypothetical protein
MCVFIVTFGFPVTLVIRHDGTAGIDTLPIARTLQNTYDTLVPITILSWQRWYPKCAPDDITRCAPQKWFHDSQLVHNATRNCPGMRNTVCPIADEVLLYRVTVVLTYLKVTF